MAMKCMLTFLLLTCCAVLLIIILSGLMSDGDDDGLQARYNFASSSSQNFDKYIEVQNEKLLLKNNPMRILNLKDFQYVIDTRCNYSAEDFENLEDYRRKAKAVWLITSYAGDVSKRSALRHAYSNEDLIKLGVRRIFLLGVLDEQAEKKTGISQAAIQDEADRFEDIIQGNFVEAYKNLTYKHLMGLQWAVDRCVNSYSYIMKMDDDIVINLYEAMGLLEAKVRSNRQEDFLVGYIMKNMTPIRNTANKWYVTNEEFPGKTYPSFLSGWFYMTNMLTALKLIYQSRHHLNYFWIDDLFITGILREEAGIYSMQGVNELFASDYRFLKCCLEYKVEQPKYKCDYIVGPDGADPTLLVKFQKYSENCYYNYNCVSRPKNKLLKDTCILEYKNDDSNLGVGIVQEEELPPNTVY